MLSSRSWKCVFNKVLCVPGFQSEGASDEVKRQQMERLLRDELDKWDNDGDLGGRASAPNSAKVFFSLDTPPRCISGFVNNDSSR